MRNAGDINGAVTFAGFGNTQATVLNTGRILGDLDFGSGDDLLRIGGTGFVTGQVTGGAGHDTLVGGTDRITDYQRFADRIEIADHAGGFAGLDIRDWGVHLKIAHDGGTILLMNQAGITLAATDFDFA